MASIRSNDRVPLPAELAPPRTEVRVISLAVNVPSASWVGFQSGSVSETSQTFARMIFVSKSARTDTQKGVSSRGSTNVPPPAARRICVMPSGRPYLSEVGFVGPSVYQISPRLKAEL